MNYGFQLTELDVECVLRRQHARVINAHGESVDALARRLLDEVDAGQVERAALKYSTELEAQTEAAYEELERELVAKGVLRDAQDQVP